MKNNRSLQRATAAAAAVLMSGTIITAVAGVATAAPVNQPTTQTQTAVSVPHYEEWIDVTPGNVLGMSNGYQHGSDHVRAQGRFPKGMSFLPNGGITWQVPADLKVGQKISITRVFTKNNRKTTTHKITTNFTVIEPSVPNPAPNPTPQPTPEPPAVPEMYTNSYDLKQGAWIHTSAMKKYGATRVEFESAVPQGMTLGSDGGISYKVPANARPGAVYAVTRVYSLDDGRITHRVVSTFTIAGATPAPAPAPEPAPAPAPAPEPAPEPPVTQEPVTPPVAEPTPEPAPAPAPEPEVETPAPAPVLHTQHLETTAGNVVGTSSDHQYGSDQVSIEGVIPQGMSLNADGGLLWQVPVTMEAGDTVSVTRVYTKNNGTVVTHRITTTFTVTGSEIITPEPAPVIEAPAPIEDSIPGASEPTESDTVGVVPPKEAPMGGGFGS